MNIPLLSSFMSEPTGEIIAPIAHDILETISSTRMKFVAQSIPLIHRAINAETPTAPMGHDFLSVYSELKNHLGTRAVQPEAITEPVLLRQAVRRPLLSEAIIEMPQQSVVVTQTADELDAEYKALLQHYQATDQQAWVDMLSQAANESAKSGEETSAHIAETAQQY